MTTIKLKAEGRVGYDIIDARIAGKSKKHSRREANRRIRHNLKAELNELAHDDLVADFAARLTVKKLQRLSGIGAKCVFVRNGKVVVL